MGFCAIGIPVACTGVTITWAIKKYKEFYRDQTSKDSESKPVNEVKNINVPSSKEPYPIRQEIKVDSNTLTDEIKVEEKKVQLYEFVWSTVGEPLAEKGICELLNFILINIFE